MRLRCGKRGSPVAIAPGLVSIVVALSSPIAAPSAASASPESWGSWDHSCRGSLVNELADVEVLHSILDSTNLSLSQGDKYIGEYLNKLANDEAKLSKCANSPNKHLNYLIKQYDQGVQYLGVTLLKSQVSKVKLVLSALTNISKDMLKVVPNREALVSSVTHRVFSEFSKVG
jgi:ribosomal protein S6